MARFARDVWGSVPSLGMLVGALLQGRGTAACKAPGWLRGVVAVWLSGWLPACSMATWHAAEPQPKAPSALHGDLRCVPGEGDCNACAEDVVAQFADGKWKGGNAEWSFAERRLRGVTPDEAYHGGWGDHVQGFVRLNGPGVRYLMVHSGGLSLRRGRFASLSLISEQLDGQYALTDLRPFGALHGHTSGLFTLGRHVGLFTWNNRLALLDVAGGLGAPLVEYKLLAAGNAKALGLSPTSGGVAMVRLAEGGYLLVANQGGKGPSSGHSHFFRVSGDLSSLSGGAVQHPISLQELGDYQTPTGPLGPDDYHHSENLSLLTECGSGDLYTVHVGSSVAAQKQQVPRTFWRVARVVVSGRGATLEPVGVYTRMSTLERCFGRAAGSAFVNLEHRIELLCHQWRHAESEFPEWNFWRHRSTPPPVEAAGAGAP